MTETASERFTHTTPGTITISGGLLSVDDVVVAGIFIGTKSASRASANQRSTRLVDVISQTINSKGIDAAVAQYRNLRDHGFPGLPESISDTNNLGYQFLRKGENQAAIQIFRLNVETHPKSSNAYDSLGEAYAAADNKDLAIENYRKAFAVNSENTNAKAALLRLTGAKYGVPAVMHFFLGSIALSAAAGDVRMLLRGGVFGTQRISRHLWRMCFGLWIAAGSVFLARQQLFPAFLRNTGALYFLTALPLLIMVFWLVRIRFTSAQKRNPAPARGEAYSAPA